VPGVKAAQRLDTARRLQRRRLAEANSNNLRFLEVLQFDVPEKVQRRHARVAQQIDHRPGEMRQEQSPAIADDTGFAFSAKLCLTNRWPSASVVRINARTQFTSNMKKLFTITMLVTFAMVCSCQKQSSAAERQLAQRKAELDAREKALDEREKELALRETVIREHELAKNEKAAANARTTPPDAQLQGQTPDPSQLKAKMGVKIEQLPAEVQALIPDPAVLKAQRDARMQEALARRQRLLEDFQRRGKEAAKTDPIRHAEELKRAAAQKTGQRVTAAPAAVSPGAEAALPPSSAASPPPAYPPAYTAAPLSVYPGAEASSPSPSPTPQ
jgi:hypothetical protein